MDVMVAGLVLIRLGKFKGGGSVHQLTLFQSTSNNSICLLGLAERATYLFVSAKRYAKN